MARQEVFHGLRDGACPIEHAAVAQHHDKEAQAAARLPDFHRAEGAPITLGTLAGSKRQFDARRLSLGLTVRRRL